MEPKQKPRRHSTRVSKSSNDEPQNTVGKQLVVRIQN